MDKSKKFQCEFAGRSLCVEVGHIALQSNGSCIVQYGETVVLATATINNTPREGIDFFPLMVDYEEKLYAVGRIKGSRFIKREGRPTDEAVLIGRKIDRGLRPLFDQSMRNDVQVITSVLSYDGENNPDVVAILAASIALHISDIPWHGPLVAMRIGYVDGSYVLNPRDEEKDKSSLDLVLSATANKVLMVDAGASEVDEAVMYGAFEYALNHSSTLVKFIEEIRSQIGKEKLVIASIEAPLFNGNRLDIDDVKNRLIEFLKSLWEGYLFNIPRGSKKERKDILRFVKEKANSFLIESYNEEVASFILKSFDSIAEAEVTLAIIEQSRRIDGREITDIRSLSAQVGFLPRTHGSAVFMRGETQVISTVTLGAPGDVQVLDGMEDVGKKHYMHHYNFPPFSVGEVSPLRGASRRDIGHGALAEKAMLPVLPSKDLFPYTIRVVSEVMGSNGSSSMASACGSSLALMDAGVPITRPVAGVAIGLASDETDRFRVITDIQDLEDGEGGMDFKICGTTIGITAIQMDTKTNGLTLPMIREAFDQGLQARLKILDVMTAVIAEPRAELSKYAPRIITMHISPDKIRDVIGPGGKMINQIIDETGVSIDIEDDGTVFITAVDADGGRRATEWITRLTKEIMVGEVYDGRVSRIMEFGAFVEILPQKEGMVHVSELSTERVEKVGDVVSVGDVVKVKVIEVDNLGRINLSIRQITDPTPRVRDSRKSGFGGGGQKPFNKRGGVGARGDRPRRG